MKIIYYSTAYFASHGGSNHSRSFVECCRKNGNVAQVIVFPSQNKLRKPFVSSSAKGRSFFGMLKKSPLTTVFRFFRRSSFYQQELYETINEQQPDAIVMRLDSNFRQVRQLKKKFPDLIVVTEVNASPFDESFKQIAFRKYFQRLERKNLSWADLNFFVSDLLRKKIMGALVNESRDFFLPNGVDVTLFTPALDKKPFRVSLGLPADKKIIGYVGTLDISKRMNLLIEAYGELYRERKDVFFVIIGDGPEFSVTQEAITKNGLQDAVLLTGHIPHNKVPDYLRAFDLAVHHAANDYMCPLKLFEYLAAGVPAIGPDTPAVKEVFVAGEHLLLCRPEVNSILRSLKVYLNDLSAANNMIKSGMNLVYEKYTWQANADTVINKIKRIKGR